MNKIPYMKSDNYNILYDTELQVYLVSDRNNERATSQSFNIAADAIDWAEQNYNTLC